MKKTILLISCLLFIKCASAQLVLSGTSYTQNFDSIGTSLPIGWSVRDSAVDDGLGNYFLGNDASKINEFGDTNLTTEPAFWLFTSGNFRNYASADGIPYFGHIDSYGLPASQDTTNFQFVATNRALGVRQVALTSTHFPASDPGAAFCLNIANTKGLTGFKLSLELQSLDSLQSVRVTTWSVDYGIGALPSTYTLANAQGTLTTGGYTFSNNTITVDFGNALDNQSSPIWIRIGAFIASEGQGDRATTAIDNFNLTWTGSANGIKEITNQALPLQVVGTSSHSITLDFSLPHGLPVIASVYDIAGREIYSGKYNCNNGDNRISINTPQELASGMYFVRLEDEQNYGVAKAIIAK